MKNLATLLTILSIILCPAASEEDATCIAESAALVTSAAVSGPYAALRTAIETDVTEDFMQFCSVIKRTCTLDVADYSQALEAACVAEGGQIVSKEAYLDCTGKLMNIPIPGGIDVDIFNIPGCVGASCDPQNLPAAIEAVFDTAVEEVAKEVETAVEQSDITCGGVITDAGSGGASTMGSTFLAATVSFAILSSLTLF